MLSRHQKVLSACRKVISTFHHTALIKVIICNSLCELIISIIATHNFHIQAGTEIHKKFIKSRLPSRHKNSSNLNIYFIKIAHRVTFKNDFGTDAYLMAFFTSVFNTTYYIRYFQHVLFQT